MSKGELQIPPSPDEIRTSYDREYRSREVRRRYTRRYPPGVPDTKTEATAPVVSEES